jgi:hypothetical protein
VLQRSEDVKPEQARMSLIEAVSVCGYQKFKNRPQGPTLHTKTGVLPIATARTACEE